ncbi:hypothetical protein VTK26DRAFT_8316 [Humicola hyalothermophila]
MAKMMHRMGGVSLVRSDGRMDGWTDGVCGRDNKAGRDSVCFFLSFLRFGFAALFLSLLVLSHFFFFFFVQPDSYGLCYIYPTSFRFFSLFVERRCSLFFMFFLSFLRFHQYLRYFDVEGRKGLIFFFFSNKRSRDRTGQSAPDAEGRMKRKGMGLMGWITVFVQYR